VAEENPHFFGVRCTKCGHVTWFDKRQVCAASGDLWRVTVKKGVRRDEVRLVCENEKCKHQQYVAVDCLVLQ
jgi:ssDNA-binding Zn-finger/Zn-ribbon topoisomerase 1